MQYGMASVLGVVLGAGIGFGTLQSSPSDESDTATTERPGPRREYPRSRTLPPASDQGVMTAVRALVEPASIDTDGNGEQLIVHVLVENQRGEPVFAQYALELADDRGRARMAVGESPPLRLAPHGRSEADVLGVPSGLPDGFYKLDLVVAAAGRSASGVVMEPLYVRVRAREVHPLTMEEFYTASNANLEVIHAPRP